MSAIYGTLAGRLPPATGPGMKEPMARPCHPSTPAALNCHVTLPAGRKGQCRDKADEAIGLSVRHPVWW